MTQCASCNAVINPRTDAHYSDVPGQGVLCVPCHRAWLALRDGHGNPPSVLCSCDGVVHRLSEDCDIPEGAA